MSQIHITLKKNKIGNEGRYEEYVWLNKKCYSIFKDGNGMYSVIVDSMDVGEVYELKRNALKALTEKIISEGRYGA